MALPGVASAHSGEESYVYLDIYDTSIEGRIELPIIDVNDVLGLDIPQGEEADAAVAANLRTLQEYAADHFAIGTAAEPWAVVFDGYGIIDADNGSYAVLQFEVDKEFESTPREFTTTYDGILHAKPERSALLIIGTDFGSGTFNNEASELLRYSPGSTTQAVDLGDTSFWKGVSGVIGLGVEHIRIGTDHILFIFALVLPSVLVFGNRWEPAPSFGSGLWRVLKIVSMFTVAHTITLTLGGLGIVELPSGPVETIIALSIALAALHNIWPQFVNKEWLLAFGFGLFHGFGFAGLLSDLGLTQSRRFVSLLGFNLGIELGQAVIILLVFPALFLLRRTRFYVPGMYAASIGLAVIATGWALDRALGITLPVDELVDRIVAWPRALFVVAVLTVLATAVVYFERSRGRLLPVAGESEASIRA